jgi:hypothetical protein
LEEKRGLYICISLPVVLRIIAGGLSLSNNNKEGKQMKNKTATKILLLLLILSVAAPMSLRAQTTEQSTIAEQTRIYSQEELDRLLAPIALYPDNLLSQFLMAATYPLEVVEADRWIKQNQNLTGDQLDAALQDKSWDVSVKSLCHFPNVLAMMSDKLTLTNEMGNAFLSQQEQVMNTIQSLRAKAQAQGNLVSTDKQNVVVQEGDISIEPVTPDVVYVPAYDPCWVYGPWWYPACAPLWFWYPGIVVGAGFFFGPAIFIGPLDFWGGFHWHRREMFVHRPGRMHGGTEIWQHNPIHRRGIAYRNPETARRFGQIGRPGVEARREFRGFTPGTRGTGTGIIPQTRPETGRIGVTPQTRPGTGRIAVTPQTRPESGRVVMQPRVSAGSSPARQLEQPRSGSALDSFGSSGREVKQNSERGHESIGDGMRGGNMPDRGSIGGGGGGGGRRR